jgi:hypothetical protein
VRATAGADGRGLLLLLEAEEDHGDVVAASISVGGVDQLGDGAAQAAALGQDPLDLLLVDHRGQPVAAEEKDVPGAGGEGHRVHRHPLLGTQRAGDHRALGMLLGLLVGKPSLAAELLDQRVVLGEALELAVAEDVGAAVADVGEADIVAAHHRGGQRGPHPGAGRVALGELVDLMVCLAEQVLELSLGRAVLGEVAFEGPHGDAGGDLTRLGPAHPVRHREDRSARVVGVLVGVALLAGVSLLCLFGGLEHLVRYPGISGTKRNSVSPIRIRSPSASSASPCSCCELSKVPLVELRSSTK